MIKLWRRYDEWIDLLLVVGVVGFEEVVELLARRVDLVRVRLQLAQQRVPLQRQERQVEKLVQELESEAVPHRRLGVTDLAVTLATK